MFGWYGLAIVIAEVARQSKTRWRSFRFRKLCAKLAGRLPRQQAMKRIISDFGFAE
jgi:hypothetical protein